MLSENKLFKYLIYAIGEVLLVVVGILIALQINNANEDRLSLENQITILENIKSDILADSIDIGFNLKYQKIYHQAEKDLLQLLMSDLEHPLKSINYNDALGAPLLSVFHKSSFSNLQSNDIGLITNNQLYKQITRYYDFFEKVFSMLENENNEYNSYGEKLPYFKLHFKITDQKLTMVNPETDSDDYIKTEFEHYKFELLDLSKAKSDEAFKMTLSESAFLRSIKVIMYKDMSARNKKLAQLIDQELEVLRANQ